MMLDWIKRKPQETPVNSRGQFNEIVLTRYGLLDDMQDNGVFHLPTEQDLDAIYQRTCQSGRLTVQTVQDATQKHYSGRLRRVEE